MFRASGRSASIGAAALLAAASITVILRGADTVTTRPATTSPGTGPGPASTRPATQRPTTQVSLTFKDAPLDTVLDYLSDAAGFVIVKEAAIDGRVTLVSRQPLNTDEAIMVLNTVLKSNGYAAVRQGRVLKIVSQDKAKKLGTPVHFGADPAGIEATDELITQVIPVINIDAVKLKQDLSPVMSTDTDVTANGGSNAIVVTDTSANIKRIVEMIVALDQHESGNYELRRYELKNANAVAATRLLVAIFRPDDSKPAKAPPANQEPSIRGKINAVADERTNTMFVTAAADTLLVVDGILKELDANPASVSAIRIFPLKYADAAAAVKLLSAIFKPEDLKPRFPGEPPLARSSELSAKVNAGADDRTNSVVVAAPTETLTAIEDILNKLDSDPSSISETKVIPLLNADAVATAKLITAVYKPEDTKAPPASPYLQISVKPPGVDQTGIHINAVADDRTNSLVITAPTETLKGILDIVKTLDGNPASSSTIKVFQLKFADAEAAVKLITTIFKSDEAPGSANIATGVAPVAKVQGVSEQASKIKVSAAADDRTNTLVVSAPMETMRIVEGIIRDLDSNPAADQAIFIYKLKNGQSQDLEPVLNAVFGNSTSSTGSGQRPYRTQQISSSSNTGLSGGSAFGSGSMSRSGRGLGQGLPGPGNASLNTIGGSYASSNSPAASLSQSAAHAAGELSGQVSIVAESDTNSLIISTAAKYMDRVKAVIDELDRPVPQVLIKVLIAEVSHDNSEDLGVDFSVLNQRASGNGEKAGTNFDAPAVTGGLVVSFLEKNVSMTLRALATAGKLDVLSRPYILASDNQLASITVGQEVPFITDTRTTDLGQTINTIQYQDIGIILNVTPHINNEGLVILDVAPEISQLTGTTVPISEVVNAPVFAKRSAQSRVGIRDGQTIVIGGLMEDRKTSTVQKVPILGDIPLLGQLFRRTQISKTKTELLIFLTPHVAQQPDALKPMSADEMKGTTLTPRAVGPGTFEDHMRGMQRGATQPTSLPTAQP
jgi:general secretion pathway protein D